MEQPTEMDERRRQIETSKIPASGRLLPMRSLEEMSLGSRWSDMMYRYDEMTDVYRICFRAAQVGGPVVATKALTPRASIGLNSDERVVFIDILQASESMSRPPLEHTPFWMYSPREDALDIYFIDPEKAKDHFHANARVAEPYQYDIQFDCDRAGRYFSLAFIDAKKLLATSA